MSTESHVLLKQKKIIVFGIDPQPTLLSVNGTMNEKIIYWKNHYLKKKNTFRNAHEWQEYIWTECYNVISSLSRFKPDLIVVEQQRGRVNSIIEQSIIGCCLSKNIKVTTVHPLTWKKNSLVKHGKGNAKNKFESLKKLESLNIEIPEEYKHLERKHDLADAYFIREYAESILSVLPNI